MAAIANDVVGFEEGILSWLPTHVLHDACDYTKQQYVGRHDRKHQQYGHRLNSPATDLLSVHPKSSPRKHQRPRNFTNRAMAGGPGMQAVFLDSGRKSCGTGVFLPRNSGTDFKLTNKPACSPILLPSRVVQALNINVHEIGLQLKPQRDVSNTNSSSNNKKRNEMSSQCGVICQSRSSSPDIFLPKEWTY